MFLGVSFLDLKIVFDTLVKKKKNDAEIKPKLISVEAFKNQDFIITWCSFNLYWLSHLIPSLSNHLLCEWYFFEDYVVKRYLLHKTHNKTITYCCKITFFALDVLFSITLYTKYICIYIYNKVFKANKCGKMFELKFVAIINLLD